MNIHTTPNALQNAGEKLYRIITVISESDGGVFIQSFDSLSDIVVHYTNQLGEIVTEHYDSKYDCLVIQSKPSTEVTISGDIRAIEFSSSVKFEELDISKNHILEDLYIIDALFVYTLNLSGHTGLYFRIQSEGGLKTDRIYCDSAFRYNTEKIIIDLLEDTPNGTITIYGYDSCDGTDAIIAAAKKNGWTVERIY